MTGHVTTTVGAGPIRPFEAPMSDGRHMFSAGPDFAIAFTPEIAQQWIEQLTPIAAKDNT